MDYSEVLIVVDKDDKVIEYLPRNEVHAKKLLHRTISIVILNTSGEVLLQQRSMNQDTYPGLLGNAVGGHVIKGNDYAQTVKKELKEELGVEVPLEFLKVFILEDPNHPTVTALYKAVYDGPFKFQKKEISSLKFYFLSELPKLRDKLSPPTLLILKELGLLPK